MKSPAIKDVEKVSELLVDFWNAYIILLRTHFIPYAEQRPDLFESEVARSVHDIQGRLAILKEHLREK